MSARTEPEQLWWTADELASSRLPDLPGTPQGVTLMAKENGWRVTPNCVRRRSGRGGGFEYHWSVLPFRAKKALLLTSAPAPRSKPDRGAAWATYEALPARVKARAEERLRIIHIVEQVQAAGATKVVAVDTACQGTTYKPRTVFEWFHLIEGVAVEDRLPYLAPKHRMAARAKPSTADVRPFLDHLKSLYLRVEQPTFRECCRIAMKLAKAKGWKTLAERTAKRRIEEEVPRVTRVFMREGEAGLTKCFPAQIRDRSGMHALEAVNADCHKIDVFVEWDDGTVDRPQIIAFQDLYSNKILSWRIDHNPNKVMVMSAFGEMIEAFGIPRRCLFDNGREFANKWLTGGAKTRFRFTVREDDPLGVLPLLGIQLHWAQPAHGQAKPIERGFKDFANDIALDPRFAGAFVGKNPMAKPENYRSRAVNMEVFKRVVAEKIAEHNAREGRTAPTAKGRSFDQVFAESYASAPILRATEAQRRLWMFGQHVGRLNRNNGSLKVYGNVYFSEWMSEMPSKEVVARFDPEDLHKGLHIYGKDGEHLGFAECQQAVGFFDVAGAKALARKKSEIKKAEKALAKAHAPIPLSQIGEDLDAISPVTPDELERKIVALPAAKKQTRIPREVPMDPSIAAITDAEIVSLKRTKPSAAHEDQSAAEKFWWARRVLERSARGEDIGVEEAEQVRAYVETAEYKTNLMFFEKIGAEAVK